jgi:hypothetical protein
MRIVTKKDDEKQSCKTHLCCCNIVIEFMQDQVFEKPGADDNRLPNS